MSAPQTGQRTRGVLLVKRVDQVPGPVDVYRPALYGGRPTHIALSLDPKALAEMRERSIKAILGVGCCDPGSEWCTSKGPKSCDCLRQVDAILTELGLVPHEATS